MAVSEQTPYIEYVVNGITTSFALEFDCDNRDHLIVLVDDVEPVVGSWSFSNGAVVFNTAPENGKKITIQRNTPFSRTTDYQSYNNSFRPPAVNNDFDRVWFKIQELGVKDWLLDLKIQKFRDDVNLTALENTLEEAKQIRDETANSVIEVQSNVAQSQTLLENTTAQANLAQGYASSANSANAAAQQAAIDVSTAEADVYSALSAQQIAVNNSLTAIAGGHKAYQTLTAAQAAQASLPANTIVEVTNDGANNGTYQWNGTTLTKSAYDPKTQAVAEAKTYADQTKLDLSKITYEYVDGNKIGAKTPRYTNLGLSNLFAIQAATYYDSLVLRVKEGDVLFLLNDTANYNASVGAGFAFFAEDPNVNRTQARITDNRASATDTATSLVHQKVTVPAGAKYLMLNTRYTNAAGTVNTTFSWAIHADVFSSSYASGVEVISEVLNTPVGKTDDFKKAKAYTDQQIANTEKTKISVKNLFDPRTVISGSSYNNDGTIFYNAARRRTIKYPVNAGEWLSISGMDGMVGMVGSTANTLQFWASADGSTFLQNIDFPTVPTTTSFSVQAPVNATHFSFNINSTIIPTYLQVEKSATPTAYEPYYLLEHGVASGQVLGLMLNQSSKNLYDGGVLTKSRNLSNTVQGTTNDNDVVSSFIPVTSGKYYAISGLNLNLVDDAYKRILAFSSNLSSGFNVIKQLTVTWGDTTVIYIDDPAIKYIVLPLVSSTKGTLADAKALSLQVEEGRAATNYEPHKYTQSALQLYQAGLARSKSLAKATLPRIINRFMQLDKVRNSTQSTLATISKDISPVGMSFAVETTAQIDSASNNLYALTPSVESGTKSIYAHVMKFVSGNQAVGTLKPIAFTVPSGQFDNDTLPMLPNYTSRNAKFDYCHPDIDYSATPVAGFKYWMISSILPAGNLSDVQWEDEDLFVSNDAKTWQRVRSLYETDKSYTTATLRLPPHSLVTNTSRKFAFLPCPAAGDTIEISVPADNGMPALDRVNITLTGLPWKHDPAILIDGGYVYTYHSYHLSYADRPDGSSRFIVCVRTQNGVDWEVVRTDGSTMLLTEVNSRQIFTKDEQGRYNYMYYAYGRGYMNPKPIKWGAGDFELYYGGNFTFRAKGTTPYNFDFTNLLPMQDLSSGNHPTVLKNGTDLILINNEGVYKSSDRGVSFTKYAYYPMWLGGIDGYGYKKTAVVGDSGKLYTVEVQRQRMPAATVAGVNGMSITNDVHQLYIYEYASLTDYLNKATNGIVDAYIDVQLCLINYTAQTRRYFFMPAVSLQSTSSDVNRPIQRVKVCDLDFAEGDTLHAYITLNSRHGAKIVFGGIDIS